MPPASAADSLTASVLGRFVCISIVRWVETIRIPRTEGRRAELLYMYVTTGVTSVMLMNLEIGHQQSYMELTLRTSHRVK